MKFQYNELANSTQFIAISETKEETHGLRAQGPYTPIHLVDNTLTIHYVSKKKLHPDIIAAICITAFYPFIKYTATMPFPVSQRFADGLKMDILPQHAKMDGVYKATQPISITNIDKRVKPYTNAENTVIAYGGGMDSTAIALMFPDYPLVHSANVNDNIEVKKVMKSYINKHLSNDSYVIDTNCKQLCKPGGFTTFTNIFLIPLLLTADLNIKNICCGETLTASCLRTGQKYFPQFNPNRRNRWLRFYNHIGIHMFSPIAGCSELITSKIVYSHSLSKQVLFCEINKGKPCFNCSKCLRKLLELNYHGYNYNFNNFHKDTAIKILKKRPLYDNLYFIETIKHSKTIPHYMKECINDLIHIRTDIFHKIYSKSFIYFPENIKRELLTKLSKYADIMNKEEEKYIESWDMTVI